MKNFEISVFGSGSGGNSSSGGGGGTGRGDITWSEWLENLGLPPGIKPEHIIQPLKSWTMANSLTALGGIGSTDEIDAVFNVGSFLSGLTLDQRLELENVILYNAPKYCFDDIGLDACYERPDTPDKNDGKGGWRLQYVDPLVLD